MNSETSHNELFIEPQLGFSPSTLSRLLDLSIPALARDRASGCLAAKRTRLQHLTINQTSITKAYFLAIDL